MNQPENELQLLDRAGARRPESDAAKGSRVLAIMSLVAALIPSFVSMLCRIGFLPQEKYPRSDDWAMVDCVALMLVGLACYEKAGRRDRFTRLCCIMTGVAIPLSFACIVLYMIVSMYSH